MPIYYRATPDACAYRHVGQVAQPLSGAEQPLAIAGGRAIVQHVNGLAVERLAQDAPYLNVLDGEVGGPEYHALVDVQRPYAAHASSRHVPTKGPGLAQELLSQSGQLGLKSARLPSRPHGQPVQDTAFFIR